jgi:hypothetical protein
LENYPLRRATVGATAETLAHAVLKFKLFLPNNFFERKLTSPLPFGDNYPIISVNPELYRPTEKSLVV